ncbi:Uncharacterised protein [Amycolatopsis camponoti]|uniref:Methyltransferase type 12 domain-containing protein n=1 Tax=Amycolatopsis camponoti TaxID=2606593 RepID=A0A6I8LJC4_9PSEU|nr:class I SAM-dependent methyltransferase [Amycolatopsis camponoti]VVJ17664.1 Uncharacterised protein [Amycolatopsis camponoti]
MTDRIAVLSTVKRTVKQFAKSAEDVVQRLLAAAGARQSESRLAADSQAYWAGAGGDRWRANSHWRAAHVFDHDDLWQRIGLDHLAMADRGARMIGFDRPWSRIVDWGCGGGANAVAFAPRAAEYVGVDVSAETLETCEKEVAAVCDTPFTGLRIDVEDPEAVLRRISPPYDLFLCFYVFELIPSPEYGARLLRIAEQLLGSGGAALIQIKYTTGTWRTRPRRRAYRTGLAEMTTYTVPEFWELATACGLTPHSVQLVPRNELDERYAYFLLTKP